MANTSDRIHHWTWVGIGVSLRQALMLALGVLFSGVAAKAQVVNGINGTLTGTSGVVIVGAHLTATNIAAGVVSTAVTSSDGTRI